MSLTRHAAAARSRIITGVEYDLRVDLRDERQFRVDTHLRFDARPGSETFLDTDAGTAISSITVNGQDLDPASGQSSRIPLRGLRAHNDVRVSSHGPYSTDGQGLHRQVGDDGRAFVYAHVAPAAAGRIFPCFDQPDLKARFRLAVSAPAGWTVLSHTAPTSTDDGTSWTFPPTPPLSTYMFTFVSSLLTSRTRRHGELKLGIHAAEALDATLDANAEEVFDILERSIDYYERFFGIAYPFGGKYDVVFVPEFSNLAMENPACVLIRDDRLFTGDVTPKEHEDRAVILTHETSHMWFGNLVTMRWWDDLWLNEAFADFMGHHVTTHVAGFPGALTTFSAGRKSLAYLEDVRASSHPLVAAAPDVDSALALFDRIAYFKGSSVIRQLAHAVGDAALQEGLRSYLTRGAWGNATTHDLLTCLSEAAGRDLREWSREWLETRGPSTLAVTRAPGSLAITQHVPPGQPLRSHHVTIGLVDVSGVATRRVELPRSQATIWLEKVPDHVTSVLPNHDDWTYAKVAWDEETLATLDADLGRLDDLNRAATWSYLHLGVLDGVVPVERYMALLLRSLMDEQSPSILSEVIDRAFELRSTHVPASALEAITADLHRESTAALHARPDGDHARLLLARMAVRTSVDPEALRGWLRADSVDGVRVDDALAWLVVERLATLGHIDATGIREAQQAHPQAQARVHAIRCRALLPTPEAKATVWTTLTGEGEELSNYDLWANADGMFAVEQRALTQKWALRYFVDIRDVTRGRSPQLAAQTLRLAFPRMFTHDPAVRQAAQDCDFARGTGAPARAVADLIEDLLRAAAAGGPPRPFDPRAGLVQS